MTLPSGPSHHSLGGGSPLGLSQKISTVPFSGTANLWLGIKGDGSKDVLVLSGSKSVEREIVGLKYIRVVAPRSRLL